MNIVYNIHTLSIGSIQGASVIRIGFTHQNPTEDTDDSEETVGLDNDLEGITNQESI